MSEENGEIVFWILRKKFIDREDVMPETSRQVIYYSLAIGHHVGVIDGLEVVMRCPLTEYCQWVEQLENEQAQRKMLGVLKFDEIVIDISHAGVLSRAYAPLADKNEEPCKSRSIHFIQLLDDIVSEPAIYLMVRKVI
ncbi:formate hydrogenlyase maturation HycH family protein [Escherichia coli]|nr:formate hydrogenlyase maturation HycH family protein [Escherichia coli]EKY5819186.1 formate hydrogenlyase maturation HycH family protein [Escherichia coli]